MTTRRTVLAATAAASIAAPAGIIFSPNARAQYTPPGVAPRPGAPGFNTIYYGAVGQPAKPIFSYPKAAVNPTLPDSTYTGVLGAGIILVSLFTSGTPFIVLGVVGTLTGGIAIVQNGLESQAGGNWVTVTYWPDSGRFGSEPVNLQVFRGDTWTSAVYAGAAVTMTAPPNRTPGQTLCLDRFSGSIWGGTSVMGCPFPQGNPMPVKPVINVNK